MASSGSERYVPGVRIECSHCHRWATGREGIVRCPGCKRLYSVVVMLAYADEAPAVAAAR